MAIINELVNTAHVVLDGATVLSNAVTTLLQLPPTIVKSVDITLGAKVGSVLAYTVVITNINLSAITNLPFTDPLPSGCEYLTDSFKVNGTVATPTYTAGTNTLAYTIANIAALGVVTITFKVTVTGGDDE